jgi:hypothetical protein
MDLPPAEEAKLQMDLIGRGHAVRWSPLSWLPITGIPLIDRFSRPQLDFAYGVCAFSHLLLAR